MVSTQTNDFAAGNLEGQSEPLSFFSVTFLLTRWGLCCCSLGLGWPYGYLSRAEGGKHEAVWHLELEASVLHCLRSQWYMKKSRTSCWKRGCGEGCPGGNRKDPDGCRDTITTTQQTANASLRIRSYSEVQRLSVTEGLLPSSR